MKKLLLLIAVTTSFYTSVSAGQLTNSISYAGSSKFNQVQAQADWHFALNWSAGLAAKYADEKQFKDPVVALKLPLAFNSDLLTVNLTPFYYFENKSDPQTYKAFGVSGKFVLTLQDDAVNELYSHVYLGAAFARQQGTLLLDNGAQHGQYYSQSAYSIGLHQNFYRAFSFEAIGTAFQYPDGITGVTAWRGILDQQDLVSLQSYDIVHELRKYTVGGRLTRLWAQENQATVYLSYRFGEFYTADPEHSIALGNSWTLTNSVLCNLGYNHLRTVHNKNKRDIFYAQLKFVF